ncbi:MAG: SUMF1/EgtB/PvdO family nonheme iron enzyme [Thainema sp.]
MIQCRKATLALFDNMSRDAFCCHAHADFSPLGWHLGHIAYTESLWILQHLAKRPPIYTEYHRLFAQDGLPKTERVNLPSLDEVREYLEDVRSQVFQYLEIAPLEEQSRLWYWLLQHECQHVETMAIVLAMQERGEGGEVSGAEERARSAPDTSLSADAMVYVPAGEFTMGNESAIAAIDNERPVQKVWLEDYWIDRYPVTCGQYRQFMEAGGYDDPRWWSEAGWQWRQRAQVTQPLYWTGEPGEDLHPVCGVSAYEAEAYARFVGKRLPTEAEWEKAASWNPETQQAQIYPWGAELLTGSPSDAEFCNHCHHVGWTTPVTAYPLNRSPLGCCDMLGNVWEWTSTLFDSYAGFEPYPYAGYSSAYFDQEHWVLRGGSWATRPWALRNSFRNWYYPHMQQMFAGFRCVQVGTI